MDGETNFLVQVRGDKWFYVFDQDDRTLVTDEDRERYFSGDISAVSYRKERQKDAVAYDLKAGYGVHVPLCAPHWVQNRDNVSVAISITYELRSVDRLTRIHRINKRVRRLGFTPTPPGVSSLTDQMKLGVSHALSGVRSFRGHKESPRPYDVWTPAK